MKKMLVTLVLSIMMLFAINAASAVTIQEGYRGVKVVWGVAQDEVLSPGWYWAWFGTDIIPMSVQWQKYRIEASAFSKDIQEVDVLLSMSYQLSPEYVLKTYKQIGTEYADQIMLPNALDAIKAVFARYSAEELIAKRQFISEEIYNLIHEQMDGYGVNVKEVALENIDFTDAFEAAVEAKQVATQTALKVRIEEEQETARAQEAAKRQKIEAEAAAEVARIKAQADADVKKISAEAEAYRIEMEAKNLTQQVLDKMKLEKWDGKLPTISGGVTPIVSMEMGE